MMFSLIPEAYRRPSPSPMPYPTIALLHLQQPLEDTPFTRWLPAMHGLLAGPAAFGRSSPNPADAAQGPLGVAYGSRAHLHKDAVTKRSPLRNFLTRGFHALVYFVAGGRVRDTQCGFKVGAGSECRHTVLCRCWHGRAGQGVEGADLRGVFAGAFRLSQGELYPGRCAREQPGKAPSLLAVRGCLVLFRVRVNL